MLDAAQSFIVQIQQNAAFPARRLSMTAGRERNERTEEN
jgi:hypothetical protein